MPTAQTRTNRIPSPRPSRITCKSIPYSSCIRFHPGIRDVPLRMDPYRRRWYSRIGSRTRRKFIIDGLAVFVRCNIHLIICLVVGRRKNAAMSVLLFNFLSQFVLWQCERLFHSGESIHCPQDGCKNAHGFFPSHFRAVTHSHPFLFLWL